MSGDQGTAVHSQFAKCLLSVPAARRPSVLQAAISFQPRSEIDEEFQIGPVRAAFAEYWEQTLGSPVPIAELRRVLEAPVPIATVLQFVQLKFAHDEQTLCADLLDLLGCLRKQIDQLRVMPQLRLFAEDAPSEPEPQQRLLGGNTASSLGELIANGCKYSTVYADPPWQYENRASRGAAENHYRTMTLQEICAAPVGELIAEHAHLHLWTTNGFLREAFEVIDAWGFRYKSALVWIKDEIGMGNYWRVSHEYLLLGVRGNLTFRSRNELSWIRASRRSHSHKPRVVRALIEKVSPGPYLELYGRDELPNSAWTVYGNQIEPRLL